MVTHHFQVQEGEREVLTTWPYLAISFIHSTLEWLATSINIKLKVMTSAVEWAYTTTAAVAKAVAAQAI